MEGWGVTNILILPRQATVIDYNVPDPKSLLEFYVAEKACEWQVGVSCDSFNFTFPGVRGASTTKMIISSVPSQGSSYRPCAVNISAVIC
jgi:hypothetical protein